MILWLDPIDFTRSFLKQTNYNQDFILLYSGLNKQNPNSKSYLALYPKNTIKSDNFNLKLNQNDHYFGYFTYDLKNSIENLPKDQEFTIKTPKLTLTSFNLLLIFDHDSKKIQIIAENDQYITKIPKKLTKTNEIDLKNLKISDFSSQMSQNQYQQNFNKIKNHLENGDFYQANLTNKFYGKIKCDNKFDLFAKLTQISPANYSAYLKINDLHVISSSPELFLQSNSDKTIRTSPIKGTAPRFKDKNQDQQSINYLKNSTKEKSENLMIVDLARNDLSRCCKPNTVKVDDLFKITSYQTIHHLSSNISGKLSDNISIIDAIKANFPPASMTGAPKIKVMKTLSQIEKYQRGIYSGAIGFIKDDICNLSVVIRTLLIQNDNFEFQVGGAITYDSNCQNEWQEILDKSKAILQLLNIESSKLTY